MTWRGWRTRTSVTLTFLIFAFIIAPGLPVSGSVAAGAGGTLTGGFDVGPSGSPGVFNPITDGAGYTWLMEYFSPLVTYNVSFTKIQGELASSWDISSNGLTVTFHLRSGVKWSDGKPFTSADVKYTLNLVMNPASASAYASRFADVTSITTPNPLTAVITLKQPDAALLDALSFVVMVPQHQLGSIAPKDLVKSSIWYTNPIGTGPFAWDKYVTNQYVELKANPNYWRGRPKLDFLINRYFTSPSAALIALRAGEIQFTYVTATDAAALRSDTSVQIIHAPSQILNYLGFNLRDPRFSDIRVRQAIMYAIDRPTIVSKVLKTGQVAACSFSNPAYIPSGVNSYAFSVAKAKALLQQANWSHIHGAPIQIVTYYNDTSNLNALAVIQQELAQVGISVTIRSTDNVTYGQISNGPNWHMLYAGALTGPDPDAVGIYLLAKDTPPNGINLDHVNIPAVDQGFALGRSETDPVKRALDYQSVCRTINAQVPIGPMWVQERFGAVSSSVKNFVWTPAPGGGRYYQDAQNWSLS
ncbi:MAG: putative dipeptide transporter, periplasmic component [Chloroflexi bacterium]|jgi:peptide/nickel transport system substrate-binding protein|nr:putative dipeptide transporter, periplasmic component [Chloroflexota bacterium]